MLHKHIYILCHQLNSKRSTNGIPNADIRLLDVCRKSDIPLPTKVTRLNGTYATVTS
jgi:hypothetical protein